jgi:hypothetical protein
LIKALAAFCLNQEQVVQALFGHTTIAMMMDKYKYSHLLCRYNEMQKIQWMMFSTTRSKIAVSDDGIFAYHDFGQPSSQA